MYGARWWLSSPKTQDVVGRGPFVPQDMVAQRSSPVSACGWSVDPAWTKRGQAGDEWPMSPAGAWPDRHRTDVRFLAVPPAPSVAGHARGWARRRPVPGVRSRPSQPPRGVAVHCPTCQSEVLPGQKFCPECGTRIEAACSSCGAALSPNAKFCPECGTPAQAPGRPAGTTATPSATAAETPVAERRLVSVLFADLVGFTAASQDRDPEETRELLTRYFELARERIERYGGTIEKFIGDAVMAVWGAPTAHEDDAERAVRAALDLVEAVPNLGTTQRPVQARAGVLTGEAAVTLGAQGP